MIELGWFGEHQYTFSRHHADVVFFAEMDGVLRFRTLLHPDPANTNFSDFLHHLLRLPRGDDEDDSVHPLRQGLQTGVAGAVPNDVHIRIDGECLLPLASEIVVDLTAKLLTISRDSNHRQHRLRQEFFNRCFATHLLISINLHLLGATPDLSHHQTSSPRVGKAKGLRPLDHCPHDFIIS